MAGALLLGGWRLGGRGEAGTSRCSEWKKERQRQRQRQKLVKGKCRGEGECFALQDGVAVPGGGAAEGFFEGRWSERRPSFVAGACGGGDVGVHGGEQGPGVPSIWMGMVAAPPGPRRSVSGGKAGGFGDGVGVFAADVVGARWGFHGQAGARARWRGQPCRARSGGGCRRRGYGWGCLARAAPMKLPMAKCCVEREVWADEGEGAGDHGLRAGRVRGCRRRKGVRIMRLDFVVGGAAGGVGRGRPMEVSGMWVSVAEERP